MARAAGDGRRRVNDPDGVRRRIVDAAYAAFSTRGYHSTSIHDLKQAAGATGGALAHHFPTKKDMAIAVIGDHVAKAVEDTWIRPVLSSPSAAEGIAIVFNTIAADLERQGFVSGCPLNNLAIELSRYDDDIRLSVESIFRRWRAAIADKLKTDHAAGLVDVLDPEAFATLVVASYSGAMAMAKASQDARPLRACAKQLVSIMRRHAAESGE
jgi:AcrR family transcriptional regulator